MERVFIGLPLLSTWDPNWTGPLPPHDPQLLAEYGSLLGA